MDFCPGFAIGPATPRTRSAGAATSSSPSRSTRRASPTSTAARARCPYVKLRSLDTGVEAWFANFHNPAETSRFHRQQRFRDRATGIEIALANRLIATGLPVFITGDMNERAATSAG